MGVGAVAGSGAGAGAGAGDGGVGGVSGAGEWGAPDAGGGGVGLPSLAGRPLHVLNPSGGSVHFLFELRARESQADAPAEGGNTLGKLEICWKGNMGEAGRLQTQQILVGRCRLN